VNKNNCAIFKSSGNLFSKIHKLKRCDKKLKILASSEIKFDWNIIHIMCCFLYIQIAYISDRQVVQDKKKYV